MRSESNRLAAIVLGTLVDLIETLKFSKSRLSISSVNSTAAVTRASTGCSRSSSCRCLGREPELTPIRIGTPAAFAFSATSATFSRPPMLPGLSRMQWAPASIAFRARVWLKWMSAITGIGGSLTMVGRASGACSRGTAQRTRSAPASATVRICSIVAARLAVSVLVIVCTATGAPPPIGTSPTNIWRLEAMYGAYFEPLAGVGRILVVNGLATPGGARHARDRHLRSSDGVLRPALFLPADDGRGPDERTRDRCPWRVYLESLERRSSRRRRGQLQKPRLPPP